MRPFLFLGTRAEDAAADNEYAAMLAGTGLAERDLRRVRLERDELGPVDLDEWSGILLGGGPFNVSDPAEPTSRPPSAGSRPSCAALATRVVAADFPSSVPATASASLGSIRGGVVDRTYGEPVGCVEVTLTDEGRDDPLLADLPDVLRRVPRSQGGRVAGCPRAPCGSPARPAARCRRSGSASTPTPPSSTPSSTPTGSRCGCRLYRDHGYFPPEQAARA